MQQGLVGLKNCDGVFFNLKKIGATPCNAKLKQYYQQLGQ